MNLIFQALHNFNPNPILFNWGIINIRWYGFFIVLSLILGLFILIHLGKKEGVTSDDIFDLSFWLMLFGLVGARAYEVFIINWWYYQNNLSDIVKIWRGGIAIHGAFIAGALVLLYWTHKKKKSFWLLADLLVIPLALGQAIGRWGNYFNQELFGLPTSLPWGIPIEQISRPLEYINSEFFHPTFLYESILNLILFALLWFMFKKFGGRGIVASVYLIGYGIIRFLMEFVRIDLTPELWLLRLPQIVSIMLVVAGISLIIKHTLSSRT